jgi:hypothetical protein
MKNNAVLGNLAGLCLLGIGVFGGIISHPSRLAAQGVGSTATVQGTVTDTSGAAVVGAQVTVKNLDTGTTQTFPSDAQGRYLAPTLPIGNYEVSATHAGFQTVTRKGIELTVGAQAIADFSLPVGQSQQTVTVQAEVSQVETTSSAITNLVEQTEIRELPLNGRNFTQLITLAPGVTPIAGGSSFYGQQQNYTISGSRPSGQSFLLDDTDTAGFWNHGTGSGALGSTLGVDAIAEFQTLTNTYSAQFGGTGAVMNASTKSGTNTFHGSAYEFLRNSAVESRNFFDGSQAPTYRQNQFGATIGGPIKKDKLFFFVNYEGYRSSKTVSSVATVPDACAHNFLSWTPTGCGAPIVENANPQTAAAVRAVMALYPVATSEILSGGVPSGTGFVTQLVNTRGYENYTVGRVDYAISAKDNLFFRYVLDRATRTADSIFHSDPEQDLTRNNYATIEERRIFTPTLVNLAHFSFVRNNEAASVIKTNAALQFYPGSGREDGSVSMGSGITGISASSTLPFYLIPNKFTVGDDIIWTHGSHNIKAGMNIQRLRENTWGPFVVDAQWTFANLTNFLQGIPSTVTGQLSDAQYPRSDASKDFRELLFTPYIQDDWKVSSRLTLNLGFRYEPTTDAGQVRHEMENLLNAPYGNWTDVNQVFAKNVSLKNWEPRIGAAWDVFADHKTSIRAGFGIFHDVVIARNFDYWLQPPFLTGTQTSAQGATFPTPFTNIPVGSGAIPTNGSVSCTNCTYYGQTRTPTTYQYNFNIQREIASATILTVGFVGAHANFLEIQHDWNYAVPFIGADGNQVFGTLQGTGSAASIVGNPRLNPTWNTISMSNAQASSHYAALQAGLNRRLSHGVQAQVSYTFSKSMDDGSGTYGLDGGGSFNNPTNMRADYGLSNFSRTHNFRVSSVYQLPFRANNRLVNGVIGGWQLTGIGTYTSGAPFSVSVGYARTFNGGYTPRPNFVSGCNLYPSQQTLSNWFNTACYSLPPVGEFGNLGRDTLIGPNLWNIDSSLSKEAKISKFGENFTLQFRAEFFNILNHPSFGAPGTSLWTQPSGAALSANPNVLTPNPSVNLITSTTSQPRQIQFGLKLLF